MTSYLRNETAAEFTRLQTECLPDERRFRAWQLGLPAYADLSRLAPLEVPRIIAVGGGKGGVGKSLVAANLAACLAQAGRKVLAVDLDIGGANLHTYFGIVEPRATLAEAVLCSTPRLRELVTPTSVEGVGIIAGGGDEHWGGAHAFDRHAMRRIFEIALHARRECGTDIVLLDLGAGIHRHTIDFFTAAHLGLVTVLPEPTSIENAYLFLKTALFRFVDNVGERLGCIETGTAIKNALLSLGENDSGKENNGRTMGYADRLRRVSRTYPGLVAQIEAALAARTLGIAMNQVRSQKDIDIGRSMELIGERYFGLPSRYLGYLSYDDSAWKSLRNRRLLMLDFPQSPLGRRISELAKAVIRRLDADG